MEPSKYKYPITAKLIRDARLRSGLQQKDFISQNNLEITQATFSRWETGQAQVPVNAKRLIPYIRCKRSHFIRKWLLLPTLLVTVPGRIRPISKRIAFH
ncbi:DNA-binding transcriptional regulator [Vibrio sp. Evd11]|uniref:helix-turn-helix domain-containing protein n=1 Tax=Vibrio sp. Evd11 TaxID=1207404 RepID=UPI0020B165CA|nr:hypothetical protein [Vibrio sp. Evd11]